MRLIILLILLAGINSVLCTMEAPTWITASIYWVLVAVYWERKVEKKDDKL